MRFLPLLLVTITLLFACSAPSGSTTQTQTPPPQPIISTQHGYVDTFTPEKLAELQASTQPFVVFVSADWCPGCVKLVQELYAQQDLIPAQTAVLVADFDTHTTFKEQHDVTVKHTAVYFDTTGTATEVVTGVDLQDLTTYLQSARAENNA